MLLIGAGPAMQARKIKKGDQEGRPEGIPKWEECTPHAAMFR
jgi:hypothetical protein